MTAKVRPEPPLAEATDEATPEPVLEPVLEPLRRDAAQALADEPPR